VRLLGKPTKRSDRDKGWYKRPLDRRVDTRSPRTRILIVTEGERTEPNYFNAISERLPRGTVEIAIEGCGFNTIGLVKEAARLRDLREPLRQFDEVWVVYDKDDFPPEHFNDASQLSDRLGLKAAWSNEAFELWYVLHFQDLKSGLPRDDYSKMLKKHLGEPYVKNAVDMFLKLEGLGSLEDACRRGKHLAELSKNETPAHSNPCTMVFKLVERLLEFQEVDRTCPPPK
jgi:hypothetical protein